MERLLHYIWTHKLYPNSSLTTTNGSVISVLDPGVPEAGTGFSRVKIKEGHTIRSGQAEIHHRASDFLKRGYDKGQAYDAVILLVTGENDATIRRSTGEVIPQLVLTIPDGLRETIDRLLRPGRQLPCAGTIGETDAFLLSSWLNALTGERLERKTGDVFTLLEQKEGDWNEVFYLLLTRNFGFGRHSDAFQRLANSLPFRYIQKHRHSLSQVEALLLGQAGLLHQAEGGEYYRLLKREYHFLAHKFRLKPLNSAPDRQARVRPGDFSWPKLTQLARLWFTYDTLFSRIIEANTLNEIRFFFRINPCCFDSSTYPFGQSPTQTPGPISEKAIHTLIINTVTPLFFAYGIKKDKPEYCERALKILERMAAEQNQITRLFENAGVKIRNAADSQAVIQLKREYCEKKKCLDCRIGFYCLKRQTKKSAGGR